MQTNTILFLGPTGSGKETQAVRLAEKTGFSVFSTGKRYRELRAEDTDLALRMKEEYDAGLLMPAWFSTYLFQEAFLSKPFSAGVICEGLGRTVFEAEQFHALAEWLPRPYRVFCLNISEEESMKRQMLRAETQNRPDSDSPEKIRVRFAEYHKHTQPAIDFFRTKGMVVDINGEQTPDAVFADVLKAFESLV